MDVNDLDMPTALTPIEPGLRIKVIRGERIVVGPVDRQDVYYVSRHVWQNEHDRRLHDMARVVTVT